MIYQGLLTACSFIVICAKFNPGFLKKVLGVEIYVDIGSHMFFIWLGALSGTYSGIMTGVITALCISGVLRLSKRILGYTVFEEGEWIDKPATWTIKTVTANLIRGAQIGVTSLTKGITEGIDQAKVKPIAV
jgi:hypothetical protein